MRRLVAERAIGNAHAVGTDHLGLGSELEFQAGWFSRRTREDDQSWGPILNPTYGSNAPLVALEGAFNASEGSVSAVLQPFGRCFDWDTNRVRFTGTRSGNTIALESQLNQSQVVKINVTVAASGDAAQGTYSITGGCGAGSAGPIDGRLVNLTGVWSGQMGSIPARLDMQMADAPDADGNFNVSGTATFTGQRVLRARRLRVAAAAASSFPTLQVRRITWNSLPRSGTT